MTRILGQSCINVRDIGRAPEICEDMRAGAPCRGKDFDGHLVEHHEAARPRDPDPRAVS